VESSSVASDLITLPMLFAGVPKESELPAIEAHKAKGGKVIYFVQPEDQPKLTLKEGEAGVVWSDDSFVKKFLFDHVHQWIGGKLGTFDGQVGANEGDMPKGQHLASMMADVLQLWSFDHTSAQHLFKDSVPQRNMFRNHRFIEDGTPFQVFKARGRGVTTVLVAAGPSLDTQWEHLRRIRQNMPNAGFIVCGRSYKQAMKHGIAPEFVMEVEQYDWNDRLFLFAPEPPPNTYLVGPLSGCPNVYHAWPNKGKVVITWDHNYAQLMGDTQAQIDNHEHSMDGGNSILHHMFNFAVWLESQTIVLAGVDFAYPPGHQDTHAQGTFHAWGQDVARTEHSYQNELMVPSTDGGLVKASQPYRNFATFLEISINKAKKWIPNLKVVNFSPKGQKIEGTVYEDVSTWAMSPPPSSVPPSSSLASGPVPFSASWASASTLTSTEPSGSISSAADPTPTKPDTTEASSTASA
jgi:hypothetical protein